MNPPVIIERIPTVAEYCDLIDAVGFRRRDHDAIETALRNSYFAVCAEVDARIVGCGRVIGDGGLHYYLTDVIVYPEHQGRGIGTRIVESLTRFIAAMPLQKNSTLPCPLNSSPLLPAPSSNSVLSAPTTSTISSPSQLIH